MSCSVEEEKWSLAKEEADFVSVLFATHLGHFQLVSVPEAYRGREKRG